MTSTVAQVSHLYNCCQLTIVTGAAHESGSAIELLRQWMDLSQFFDGKDKLSLGVGSLEKTQESVYDMQKQLINLRPFPGIYGQGNRGAYGDHIKGAGG